VGPVRSQWKEEELDFGLRARAMRGEERESITKNSIIDFTGLVHHLLIAGESKFSLPQKCNSFILYQPNTIWTKFKCKNSQLTKNCRS